MTTKLSAISVLSSHIIDEYMVAPTDAEMIVSSFGSVIKQISEIDKELITFGEPKEINENICKDAKRIRLLYKKARVDNDKIHKEIKEQVLLRSKAIDGTRNIFKLQITEKEDRMKKIENHFEIMEEEKRKKLAFDRFKKLEELDLTQDDIQHFDLGNMTEEVWDNFYKGQKFKYDIDVEAKKQRIEQERKDKEKQEKIRKENKRLQNEAIKKQKEIDDANKKRDDEKAESDAKLAKAEEEKEKARKLLEDKKEEERQAARDAILAVEEKKKEDDRNAKNIKFIEFLNKNNTTLDEVNDRIKFRVEKNNNEFSLYKLIDSIVIN